MAKVVFPYKYDGSDPEHMPDATLRERMERGDGGRAEAVLAWLVSGAVDWFNAGRELPKMPDRVKADTEAWRGASNEAWQFLTERFELAEGYAIASSDVYEQFREWAESKGMRAWRDKTFWQRAVETDWFRNGLAEKPATPRWTKNYKPSVGCTLPQKGRVVIGIRLIGDSYPASERQQSEPASVTSINSAPSKMNIFE